jgi:hypothetical protein
MMERQARWSGLVMGVGSHMIAGARACSTLTTDYRPRPTIKTNRHYAEALPALWTATRLAMGDRCSGGGR